MQKQVRPDPHFYEENNILYIGNKGLELTIRTIHCFFSESCLHSSVYATYISYTYGCVLGNVYIKIQPLSTYLYRWWWRTTGCPTICPPRCLTSSSPCYERIRRQAGVWINYILTCYSFFCQPVFFATVPLTVLWFIGKASNISFILEVGLPYLFRSVLQSLQMFFLSKKRTKITQLYKKPLLVYHNKNDVQSTTLLFIFFWSTIIRIMFNLLLFYLSSFGLP